MTAERVFISYRTDDAVAQAGRLADLVRAARTAHTVFTDEDIPRGAEWPEELERRLAECTVFVAVIGPKWHGPKPDGARRIDDPEDWVRREIETVLETPSKRIIPALVRGAKLPAADDLPESLRLLANRQHMEIRPRYFRHDARMLLDLIGDEPPRKPPVAVLGILACILLCLVVASPVIAYSISRHVRQVAENRSLLARMVDATMTHHENGAGHGTGDVPAWARKTLEARSLELEFPDGWEGQLLRVMEKRRRPWEFPFTRLHELNEDSEPEELANRLGALSQELAGLARDVGLRDADLRAANPWSGSGNAAGARLDEGLLYYQRIDDEIGSRGGLLLQLGMIVAMFVVLVWFRLLLAPPPPTGTTPQRARFHTRTERVVVRSALTLLVLSPWIVGAGFWTSLTWLNELASGALALALRLPLALAAPAILVPAGWIALDAAARLNAALLQRRTPTASSGPPPAALP